ncbi:3-deoxy-7-phosphoheptulonate synthase [Micromonospora sp. NPDC050417]|uniref:3-deoxy-7-phosphoheptulonate synthase n=1 Tax=Micromonospora sp. NPDC050417 TaxID=3364280 RepID=UPI0037A41484
MTTSTASGIAPTTYEDWRPVDLYDLPAEQQPRWSDQVNRANAVEELTRSAALVTLPEVRLLREKLADAGAGRAFVLQAGDCAESFADSPADALTKADVLTALAKRLSRAVGRSVVPVARIAGQFAKPRSAPFETAGALRLPAFRGHIINDERPTPHARRHDATRMVDAYQHASATMAALRAARWIGRVWTSHEALVLDYEVPLTRRVDDDWLLTSTHLPWIGARTNQLDHAHVALAAQVVNPVGCKVTASTSPETMLDLCERLNPQRLAGRLVLISRMGSGHVRRALPPLLRAVARAGHQVTWLCDPMHGNTVTTGQGLKTRRLDDVVDEINGFLWAHEQAGTIAGGIHLELAGREVTECLGLPGPTDEGELPVAYTSLCDPRLSPAQAEAVVDRVGWSAG